MSKYESTGKVLTFEAMYKESDASQQELANLGQWCIDHNRMVFGEEVSIKVDDEFINYAREHGCFFDFLVLKDYVVDKITPYQRGDVLKIKGFQDLYIIAKVKSPDGISLAEMMLINTTDGNNFSEPVAVVNWEYLTAHDMSKLTAGKNFERVEDFQITSGYQRDAIHDAVQYCKDKGQWYGKDSKLRDWLINKVKEVV